MRRGNCEARFVSCKVSVGQVKCEARDASGKVSVRLICLPTVHTVIVLYLLLCVGNHSSLSVSHKHICS